MCVCVCVCILLYRYKPRLTRVGGHLSPLPPATEERTHTHTRTRPPRELGVKGWAVKRGEKYSRAPHIYIPHTPPLRTTPSAPPVTVYFIYIYIWIRRLYNIILSSSRVIISYLSFSYFLRIIYIGRYTRRTNHWPA